jgi:hypothetical protein
MYLTSKIIRIKIIVLIIIILRNQILTVKLDYYNLELLLIYIVKR